MSESLVLAETVERLGVSISPHTTKATESAPVTPNTTQSRPGWASAGTLRLAIGASG
jgi:hypothetical protein